MYFQAMVGLGAGAAEEYAKQQEQNRQEVDAMNKLTLDAEEQRLRERRLELGRAALRTCMRRGV